MNAQQLEDVLREDPFTSLYSVMILPINHFLEQNVKKSSMIIFNYDECDEPGSHWVAVFVCPNGNVEYFDSYAYPPLNELLHIKINNLSRRKTMYNLTCLQGKSSVCGQYCLVYLLLRARGYHMNEIVSFFLQCSVDDERDHVVNQFINSNFHHLFISLLRTHDIKFEGSM